MNDIYKQKAKKYKYKYLKLKKEYIGTGGNADFEYIGSGSYGCIISPPFQFNIQNYNKVCHEQENHHNFC